MPFQDNTPPKATIFALPALLAAVVAGLGFGFARRPYRPRDGAVAAPEARSGLIVAAPIPAAMEVVAAVAALPEATAEPRAALTPLGERTVAALVGKGLLRKHEIAALVGIGRGSAVRIVNRLVDGGWMHHHGEGLYGLA